MGFNPSTQPVGERRLPSAVTDFMITKKNPNSPVRRDSAHKSVMNHSEYRFPRVVFSGHTIFEVSARNQTPTNLNASAKKTRMKKFELLLLASSCLPLASGVASSTTHLEIRVHALPAWNQRVPRLSVTTNCHGRTQFLPCWLCSCGPLSQACPSRGSSVQCARVRSVLF